jgi:hypothetical protein
MDSRFLRGTIGRAILLVPPLTAAVGAFAETADFLGSVRCAVILLPVDDDSVGGDAFLVVVPAAGAFLPRLPAVVAVVVTAVVASVFGLFEKPIESKEADDVAPVAAAAAFAVAIGSDNAGLAT